jgi:hypothetical protein
MPERGSEIGSRLVKNNELDTCIDIIYGDLADLRWSSLPGDLYCGRLKEEYARRIGKVTQQKAEIQELAVSYGARNIDFVPSMNLVHFGGNKVVGISELFDLQNYLSKWKGCGYGIRIGVFPLDCDQQEFYKISITPPKTSSIGGVFAESGATRTTVDHKKLTNKNAPSIIKKIVRGSTLNFHALHLDNPDGREIINVLADLFIFNPEKVNASAFAKEDIALGSTEEPEKAYV